MNFIIHFSATSDGHFKKDAIRLLQVDPSQVREILLLKPAMAVEPAMAGIFAGSDSEQEIPPISEQLNATLSTAENSALQLKLSQEVHNFLSDETDSKVSPVFSGSKQTSDLLIFDIRELVKYPQVCNTLFKILESRPCSILFLDSSSTNFNKIILKYNGKESSIFSIFAFTRKFPSIACHSEDSVLISPFTFRKSQLAIERKMVKDIARSYGSLGFIKLPFSDIEDYLHYALKVQADILVLPRTDLKEIKNIILKNKYSTKLEDKGLSFFVG